MQMVINFQIIKTAHKETPEVWISRPIYMSILNRLKKVRKYYKSIAHSEDLLVSQENYSLGIEILKIKEGY